MPDRETVGRSCVYGRGMDISSMIMGASIASVMWIAFVPWSKLRRLRELDAARGAADADAD
ncbi:hypothetical protein [Microbacterium oleivorans]|uniref:Uncharacterized protein n=1 Tax=Microbacterium oleivorans TaxID=273677 RepID=A0A7D5IWH9_9MICO|nr:hypothetical protein [Microbacterium oleivorans]QLD12042.1 hypothetical protein HW566_09855 [Microbacterium oleivorans]